MFGFHKNGSDELSAFADAQQLPASEIISARLYLGNAQNARDVEKGQNPLGISHILNVCDALVLVPGKRSGLVVEWVPIADDGQDDVFGPNVSEDEFEAAVKANPACRPSGAWWRCHTFLKEAFADKDSKILVHCAIGVNRSATIVVAWLMSSNEWTLSQSLKYVVQRRPIVNPVDQHKDQLRKFEESLGLKAPERRCTIA
eukprot:TRINITY_DN106793_c0_g1_i1.p1 TRINITY_DN106793_c0_g1~~TRINITY_DN106793_c0_g1_i1.p1  ORF type:complete len:201 (+),score=33.67 TRINITY_DN106793_c0_g1_i1:107-709(+)